jgi:hypothetical protein
MALARVVSFDGVTSDRAADMRSRMDGGERPEGLPATEILMLHDADAEKAIVILFFDSEEDYATGDATLNAMDAGDTPGQRSSVVKADVLVRMTA